jgi:transposase-like protein
MPHQRIEAVRLLINEFRRTRKVRTKPYSQTIKEQVVGLLDIDTVPRLAKKLGIANVLIYQWRRELSATQSKIPADPFIEIPIDAELVRSSNSLQSTERSVIEISRHDRSAVMRIECTAESVAFVLREFLGGVSAC